MKKISLIATLALGAMLVACGEQPKNNETNPYSSSNGASVNDYDPKRGVGKWNEENVVVSDQLDKSMAKSGENISNTKCLSCHKLSDEKLVGTGWAGVTKRRTPAWIMNFITNPDEMIDTDPEAQAMLEICLVRMPNQNLSDQEARDILEYMRQVDGVK
jgi:mono/diheme cytochrome c family protein